MVTRVVLVAAWLLLAYETAAILFGGWPTVTAIIRDHRHLAGVQLAVGAFVGALSWWLWAHLIGGDR